MTKYRVYVCEKPFVETFLSEGLSYICKDFESFDNAMTFASDMIDYDFHIGLVTIEE